MPALNKVQVIGRLGRDPESRFTPTGKKVAHFSVAVSNHWKTSEGEAKESTEWVNVEAWERLGAVCQEYLKKGSLVYIEGRLKTDRYENDGEAKYFTKIVAQTIQFLSDNRSVDSFSEQVSLNDEEELTEVP